MSHKIKALIIITFMFCRFIIREFGDDSWSKALLALDQQSYVLLTPVSYFFIYGLLVLVAALLFKNVSDSRA
jgi:hypothetical protein